jgi:hypothetical protein
MKKYNYEYYLITNFLDLDFTDFTTLIKKIIRNH